MQFTTLITATAFFSLLLQCHAKRNLAANFWSPPSAVIIKTRITTNRPKYSTAVNVRKGECFALERHASHVSFHGGRRNPDSQAHGDICLRFFNRGHCPESNPYGDYTIQFQNANLTNKCGDSLYRLGREHNQLNSLRFEFGRCFDGAQEPDQIIRESKHFVSARHGSGRGFGGGSSGDGGLAYMGCGVIAGCILGAC